MSKYCIRKYIDGSNIWGMVENMLLGKILSWQNHTSIHLVSPQPVLARRVKHVANKVW